MSGSTPSNSYFGSSGVLPELLYHVCGSAPTKMVREGIGSTPIFTNLFLRPLLWEHSHKNGIALLGVLPKSQKLYIGSDLNMIYNLDILLQTIPIYYSQYFYFCSLGVLPEGLFLVSGSACYTHIPRVLPESKNKHSGSTPSEQI